MKKKLKLFGLTFMLLAVALFGSNASLAQAATTYTAAQIATHNTVSDCWVSIEGNVYNLTSFIPIHPGGAAVIVGLCGTDATTALSFAPHGLNILGQVSQYVVGTLAVLTSVTITPTSPTLVAGDTTQLTASPLDQNGAAFTGATTTFTSSDATIATVDNTGLVTGVAAGTDTITATAVSGSTTVTGTITVTVTTATTLPGTLSAQDFGVVNYDTGLGILKGYTAGFGLTDATFSGVQSVVVKLYSGETLLQTNTATSKVGSTITGAQISSPFDVSGTFDYATDGYWTNTRESQYGQSVPATKVIATITLANGKVVTAENDTLTGDPTTIYPVTGGGSSMPNISGITAPTVLNTGQVGTWKVNASDPNNGTLSYAVDWGEIKNGLKLSALSQVFVQTATFTHAYASPGTYTVTFTVSSSSGASSVSTITVHIVPAPVTLTSVTVAPAIASVDIGNTTQLTASPLDQNGAAFTGATTTFTSSDATIATVDNTGLVTGVSTGTATITATSMSGTTTVTGTATVTVNPAPVLTSVTITPATASTTVTGSETLVATPLDQNGKAFVGATTTFSSSDPTIATVDNTGLVTGVNAGTATITATSMSGNTTVTSKATITVVTAPVITSLSGPTSATVGQTETVTVSALDPQNGSLTYSADWGDTQAQGMLRAMVAGTPFVQTSTFSHVYTSAGTYTATFSVQNGAGEIATSKMTITVTTSTGGGDRITSGGKRIPLSDNLEKSSSSTKETDLTDDTVKGDTNTADDNTTSTTSQKQTGSESVTTPKINNNRDNLRNRQDN